MTDDEKRLRAAIRITSVDLRVRIAVGLAITALCFLHGSVIGAYVGFFGCTIGAAALRDYILKPILTAIEQGKGSTEDTPEPPPASVSVLRAAEQAAASEEQDHKRAA